VLVDDLDRKARVEPLSKGHIQVNMGAHSYDAALSGGLLAALIHRRVTVACQECIRLMYGACESRASPQVATSCL